MASTEFLERKLLRLEQMAAQLRHHFAPQDTPGVLDPIMGDEDRAILMKFMAEVHHQNQGLPAAELAAVERIWATNHPREYQRVIRICGQVPVET